MKYILLFFLILRVIGCNFKNTEYSAPVDSVKLSWYRQDTAYFRRLVARMRDTTIDDFTYMSDAADLCNVAGFYFGCIDATEDQWKSTPLEQRRRLRENASAVFNEFLHSRLLFYVNTKEYSDDTSYILVFDLTESIQDKVPFDLTERLFTTKELKQVRLQMDSLQVALTKYPWLHEKHNYK